MLKENQLQKLIDKGLTYVLVSKEEDGYSVNVLTTEGWETQLAESLHELGNIINIYQYRPDAIVEYADNVELD